jgi:tripeptidyl-peptidase I
MARISCALLAICAVLASTVSASATPHRRAMSVLEQRELPSGFARTGSSNFVPSNDNVNLRVALTPKDRDGLIKTLYTVSTPGSASYGQYLSHDEVS